ncbi:MAG: N-acetyltransferase [Lachnospiraceae bacterium]|nr:N-acetyltransferase [Lachnospiraceae bacterium]
MITIRPAELADAPALREIYDYYVTNTAVSFEYETPSAAEFAARMEKIKQRYPYLLAEEDGRVLGYAYAGVFKDREAYSRSCEMTVYLDPALRRQGIGRKLYEALEEELKKQGMRNLYACIARPRQADDEYLTRDSELFHARLGYVTVGQFHACGYKFGRWYDMIWMEKIVGEPV